MTSGWVDHIPQETALAAGDDIDTWGWGKTHSSFTKTNNDRTVERTRDNSSPDYAGGLGAVGFSAGVHEWDMVITGTMSGICKMHEPSHAKSSRKV